MGYVPAKFNTFKVFIVCTFPLFAGGGGFNLISNFQKGEPLQDLNF